MADIKITIRRNNDGATCVYSDNYAWDNKWHLVFQWTDGNYGCDCNRAIFFENAGGTVNEGEDECGTGVFSIRVEWDDKILWDELNAPPAPETKE
jgi:hypothetical protein